MFIVENGISAWTVEGNNFIILKDIDMSNLEY